LNLSSSCRLPPCVYILPPLLPTASVQYHLLTHTPWGGRALPCHCGDVRTFFSFLPFLSWSFHLIFPCLALVRFRPCHLVNRDSIQGRACGDPRISSNGADSHLYTRKDNRWQQGMVSSSLSALVSFFYYSIPPTAPYGRDSGALNTFTTDHYPFCSVNRAY